VAVNVSPLQFANPALPAIVTSALAGAGVDAERLELEITESVFLGVEMINRRMDGYSGLDNTNHYGVGVRAGFRF
jgi:EAL domain-containing protein (putative c-di-GMP-specific phosphodiesterase class I)